MCWGCRPMCNNCKPAEQLFIRCPVCDSPQEFSRDQFLMYSGLPHRRSVREVEMLERWDGSAPECARCGAALAEALSESVRPQPCIRSHIVCGYPCGQRKVPLPRSAKPCKKMVPLARYDGDLSEEADSSEP